MLHEDGLYGLHTDECDRKNIPEMKKDKRMSWGGFQCKFCKNIACIKWYDNNSVSLVGCNLEKTTSISTVLRWLKGSCLQN